MKNLTLITILLGAALGAVPLAAQRGGMPAAPPSWDRALEALARGDTTDALDALRRATREARNFGPAYLRLGALLSARAGELEKNYRERVEAERALRQALRLLPNDPEPVLEYGLLLRRQQIRGDAVRTLERAWELAERTGASLPPERRAQLHYQLGLIYETWWEDWQNLVMMPPTAPPISCGGMVGPISHQDAAVLCPASWAENYERLVPLADMKATERTRMVHHFRQALAADPAHVDAAVRLLGHLADAGEWAEYQAVAERLQRAAPDDARSYLFLGLALHERGQDHPADSAFARALALLSPDERAVFHDVAPLLPPQARARYATLDGEARADANRVFFAAKNPLFLTGADERRLEHYARLAWAELKFAAPTSGRRGWDSDRGRIWVRYGQPWRWYQCCYGDIPPVRSVYWSYGENGPVFVFARPLTYRHARMTENTQRLAEEVLASAPELYRPHTVPEVLALPHQLVRFRGSEPGVTRVEVYALPPLDRLEVPPGGELEAGLFLFDGAFNPLWGSPGRARVHERTVGLTYRVELGPGEYQYSLEARRADGDTVARPAARERHPLLIRQPAARVSLSDVLLAAWVEDRGAAAATRSELRIAPLRTTDIEEGQAFAIYFEIYDLVTDDEGLGHYRASFAVEDSTRRNLVQRVTRGLQELVGRGEPGAVLRWERVAPVRDGVAIDYLRIGAEGLTPGEYVLRLRVEQPGGGLPAETVRRFRVVPRTDTGG
jgi:GWxTD domain-containing protein